MNYKKQVEDFLESINSDFYLDIEEYSHYADIKFDTRGLSITTLLKISEACMLNELNSPVIYNSVNIVDFLHLVLDRIAMCGDAALSEEATKIVMEMNCYEYAMGKTPDIFIQGSASISRKISNEKDFKQEYETKFESESYEKFKEVNDKKLKSMFNTDYEKDKKRRFSKYL